MVLVGTHTRTALIALVVGLAVAGVSLFLGNSRVRRTTLWGTVLVLIILGTFANELKTWALRGQTAQEAGGLTGRTEVWSQVIHAPRSTLGNLFGSGMSNLSFNGLAIDSNWVGTYLDQGLFGVVLDAAMLLVLLFVALTRERSPHRAIALFLIMYCIFASITETGMSNPSPYLLDLAVAASLMLPRSEGTT
jgi:O-antigen ligase